MLPQTDPPLSLAGPVRPRLSLTDSPLFLRVFLFLLPIVILPLSLGTPACPQKPICPPLLRIAVPGHIDFPPFDSCIPPPPLPRPKTPVASPVLENIFFLGFFSSWLRLLLLSAKTWGLADRGQPPASGRFSLDPSSSRFPLAIVVTGFVRSVNPQALFLPWTWTSPFPSSSRPSVLLGFPVLLIPP